MKCTKAFQIRLNMFAGIERFAYVGDERCEMFAFVMREKRAATPSAPKMMN